MCDEGLPFESLTEELLSFMELKLKSAPLPLAIIHQPRFALTLLLCKCLCHIFLHRLAKGSGTKLGWGWGAGGGRAQAGSVLTNSRKCSNCRSFALCCVGKIDSSVPRNEAQARKQVVKTYGVGDTRRTSGKHKSARSRTVLLFECH